MKIMKINKKIIEEATIEAETKKVNTLTEAETPEEPVEETATTEETELVIDDVKSASVDDIANAVIAAKEEETDGAETYSDANAKKIASEIKTYASGFDAAAWAPLEVKSVLTDKLDDCLANSLVSKHVNTSDGTDLLIEGLPGSGKTGIVRKWAKDRGVNLCYVNAKDDDLGAILNGFPVAVDETDENGNTIKAVDRAYSKALDKLKRPRSVLFLDEFNRAAPKLRASLLTLINEHAVAGPGEDGYYVFENLLFTVACINPSVPTDPGALDLNDAEMSRFVDSMDWDSTPEEARKYLDVYIPKQLDKLNPEDENYAFLYTRYKKIYNLAMALIMDQDFNFDTRDDLLDLFNEKAKMLNQRALTDALMAHGYDKQKFLNWVDNFSKFLDKDKQMIHDILDSWTEPDVQVPTDGGAVSSAEAEVETAAATNNAPGADDDSFDSLLDGTEGEETDTDLFGNTASNAGQAAKVNAADALNRIKGFDFTL